MAAPSQVTIREATHADVPAVVNLIQGLADFERLPGPDGGAAARLAEHLAEGRFELLVAEEGQQVAGYALFFPTYSTFLARPSLYLEDLYVRPDSRGRGVGEALLRRVAARALARGCGRFEWTVLDWNVRAQRFYEAMGARLLPEWRVCRVDGESLAKLAR
jgi:ribosomal protein S18 acetylase RimI-like enzyme